MSATIVSVHRKNELKCHVQVADKFHSVSDIQEALEYLDGLKTILGCKEFLVTVKEVIGGIKKDDVYINTFAY